MEKGVNGGTWKVATLAVGKEWRWEEDQGVPRTHRYVKRLCTRLRARQWSQQVVRRVLAHPRYNGKNVT
jgi:hypothetical protein